MQGCARATDRTVVTEGSEPNSLSAIGRDTGPFSARGTSKGALIHEARAVFSALAAGESVAEVREACLSGRLLRQAAQYTRSRIWDALHWRYFTWNPPPWVFADLIEAVRDETDETAFVGLAYLHYARRDRLTFDFVTQKLWRLWTEDVRTVSRNEVLDFLVDNQPHESPVSKWREETRKKLAGNVLSVLRDFGLLKGVQRKSLQEPVVPSVVVLHLARLLDEEGLRGRTLIDAPDWRLFLWSTEETAHALLRLAQQGEIRFERVGNSVVLEIPKHPLGDRV